MSPTRPEDPDATRELLDALPDATVVVDHCGMVVHFNRQAERVFGFTRQELIGRPVELLVTDELRELHRKYFRAYVSRPRIRPMGPGVDLHGRRKDGTRFPAEISLAPIEWQGRPSYCATVRDVSESRRRERILLAFRDAVPDALVIVDDRGTIVSVNPRVEECFGYRPDELIGERVEVLLPDRFAGSHEALRGQYAADPRARPIGGTGGLFARRKDGTEFPADISLAPVETDHGLLVSAAIRDISERVALQQEAERVQQEFFAMVSHELRTPLTSILGYVELMADLEELSPQARTFLQVISRSAKREERLVNDMLTLVALEETPLSIRLSRIDLEPVLRNAVEAARPQAARLGIELGIDVARSPAHVSADRDRIGQAIDNLLSNALKFTPRGGRVWVRLSVHERAVQVDVRDTGPGIPPTDANRIFERAYRCVSAVAGQVPGAGLGLTIARAITEGHHGSLTLVESSEAGTTFRLALPEA